MTEADDTKPEDTKPEGAALAIAILKQVSPSDRGAHHEAAALELIKKFLELADRNGIKGDVGNPYTRGKERPWVRVSGQAVAFSVAADGTISAVAEGGHPQDAPLQYDPVSKCLVSNERDDEMVPTPGLAWPRVPPIVVLARLAAKVAEAAE